MVYTARVCRLQAPCSPRILKDWLQCRGYHGPLTLEQIAERAEVPIARLRAYAQASQQADIPFTALVRVCRVLQDWSAFDLVLAPEGYRLTRVEGCAEKSITEETLDVAAAAGRVVAQVQHAQRGGIDVHEAASIRHECGELERQVDDLRRALPIDATIVAMARRGQA